MEMYSEKTTPIGMSDTEPTFQWDEHLDDYCPDTEAIVKFDCDFLGFSSTVLSLLLDVINDLETQSVRSFAVFLEQNHRRDPHAFPLPEDLQPNQVAKLYRKFTL